MLICTAEDGRQFEVRTTLYEISVSGNLKSYLSEVTGVDAPSLISFLPDGKQLRDENIRQLAGSQDDTIYVFNREYLFLDAELSDVIHELQIPIAIKPPLRGPVSPDAILQSAEDHNNYLPNILSQLSNQVDALRVASANLDSHVFSLSEVFDNFDAIATKELDRQAELLRNHNFDLEVISKIRVHPEFLSPAVRRDVEAGLKERMLGDYVSNVKMKIVADSCAKIHEDLSTRLFNAQQSMRALSTGADEVRAMVSRAFFDQAEPLNHEAAQNLAKLRELHSALSNNDPMSSSIVNQLLSLESAIRSAVEQVNHIYNQSIIHILTVLRQVSFLQSTLADLPATLTTLETELRGKGGFVHLQRLHQMLYVYGATLVEIVRRKEFSKFFSERARALTEVMARLSSNERKRRQLYRGEVHGQLPFESKGMDEPTPTMDVTATGHTENVFSLTRDDLTTFLETIGQIERSAPMQEFPTSSSPNESNSDQAVGHPLRETRAALEKLISRMENLGAEFDKLIERSVLTTDRLVLSKRRTASDASTNREALEQLRELQEAKLASDQALVEEREASAVSLQRLQNERDIIDHQNQERIAELQLEVESVRKVHEYEIQARNSLETRHTELLDTSEEQSKRLSALLADAAEKTKEVDLLSKELEQARISAEEMRKLQINGEERFKQVLTEQAETLKNLEEARLRGEDLEEQVRFARAEGDEAFRALNEATAEKDRLLRAQTMEADRLLRDHIAEADGDRAVLEHQFSELQATLESRENELKEVLMELDVSRADVAGLQEELERANYAVNDALQVQASLREELSQLREVAEDQTRRSTSTDHLLSDLLEIAVSFRDTNARLLASTQKTLTHASKASARHSTLAESTASIIAQNQNMDPLVLDPFNAYASPLDWSDPVASIEILKQFDLEAFSETVLKAGSTIRKWQKQCKEYRERARGKISFRNFGKGDLALFLPTRNSVSRPWAAFNVSFPHYFLKPSPQIAARLDNREWYVARIVSITEAIVDSKDPTSNPYGLGNGVKYFMLEVEEYAQSNHSQRRTVSTPFPTSTSEIKEKTKGSGRDGIASWSAPNPPSPLTDPSPLQELVINPAPIVSPKLLAPKIAAATPLNGPSSLSKLLAQAASPDAVNSPDSSPQPSPPAITSFLPRSRTSSGHSHSLMKPTVTSNRVRPASTRSNTSSNVSGLPARFSRSSTSSTKGAPTIAISTNAQEHSPKHVSSPLISAFSPSPPPDVPEVEENGDTSGVNAPSLGDSASEGPPNMLLGHDRERTISGKALPTITAHTTGPPSITGGVFATLASNFNVLSRRRKDTTATSEDTASHLGSGTEADITDSEGRYISSPVRRASSEARKLLKKFDASTKQ